MDNQSVVTGPINHIPTTVNTTRACKILANSAPSFALAPRWNNIPETFLFNMGLAVVLYILFTLLSRHAWSRRSLMKEFVECGIIEFLYGYRDPERWVAMPRFEFINRAKRHHAHELNFPYLYISPRLIAYDPNSILRKEMNTQPFDQHINLGLTNRAGSSGRATIIANGMFEQLADEKDHNSRTSSKEDSPDSPPDSPVGPKNANGLIDKLVNKNLNKTTKQQNSTPVKIDQEQHQQLKQPPPSSSIGLDQILKHHHVHQRSSTEPIDLVLSSGRLARSRAMSRMLTLRTNLNLPYSRDPMLSPPLAAKLDCHYSMESAILTNALSSNKSDLAHHLGKSPNVKPDNDSLKHIAPVNYRSSGTNSKTNSEDRSERSKLDIKDADADLNADDLHVIMSHLERANWFTKKLNQAFSCFSNITDVDLIYCKGIDAYEYLLFQRHMIALLVVINIFCLGLILPIHLLGDGLQESSISFRHTTIRNLNDRTMLYWAHIFSSFIILVTAITLLRSYKSGTITKNDILVSRRTLLVGRLSAELRNKRRLYSVFSETFPDCNIEAIQYVYDTNKLQLYQQYLESVIVAREYCDLHRVKHNGHNFMVKPTGVNERRICRGNCRLCSCCLVCLCYWPLEKKVNGSSYYTEKEKAYRLEIDAECRRLVGKPFEAAFITFKSHKQTNRVYSAIASSNFKLATTSKTNNFIDKTLKQSSYGLYTKNPKLLPQSKQVPDQNKTIKSNDNNNTHLEPMNIAQKRIDQLKNITVRYAPHPDNVEYRDLLIGPRAGLITQLLLNLLMIVIFLFLSTPTVVFQYLNQIEADKIIKGEIPKTLLDSSLANYAFVLLQVLATVMLPTFILLISQSIPYSDSASKNHSIMWKVFLFTMLMVVVLPSFGLTTSTGLIMAFIDQNKEIDMRCVFPTDNGAFFINYIISSSVIPPFMELLKPSDIVIYFFIMATSRSKADFETGRQFISKEFPIGIQYTKFLLNLAVVLSYTISCPVIAPFGLMYMLFKHHVDRYNLYYTYYTSKVDRQTQRTVEVFIRLALILMLLQSSIAISLNTGIGYFALISQILFWFALATFLNNCFFDCTSSTVLWQKKIRYQREFCACFYLPRVFEDLLKENALPSDCASFKT